MLAWSVIEYGEQIAAAGEYGHALEAIKWGTDYFIKAHTHPNVLWAEVPNTPQFLIPTHSSKDQSNLSVSFILGPLRWATAIRITIVGRGRRT